MLKYYNSVEFKHLEFDQEHTQSLIETDEVSDEETRKISIVTRVNSKSD